MSVNQPTRRYSSSRFESGNLKSNENTASDITQNQNVSEQQNKDKYINFFHYHDDILEFLGYQNRIIKIMEDIANGRMDGEVYKEMEKVLSSKGNLLRDILNSYQSKLSLDKTMETLLEEQGEHGDTKMEIENKQNNDSASLQTELDAVKSILQKRDEINDVYLKVRNEVSKDPEYINEDMVMLNYKESEFAQKINEKQEQIVATEDMNSKRLTRINKLYQLLSDNKNEIDDSEDVEMVM